MTDAYSQRQLRQQFFDAWKKYKNDKVLTALDRQVAEVISIHPEYHQLMDDPDASIDKQYLPESGETNPFLHMSLHISIRDQVTTNNPTGITKIYNALCHKFGDQHDAEHKMIECLASFMWEVQSQNKTPDMRMYIENLRRL
jgi:hypothetical protein